MDVSQWQDIPENGVHEYSFDSADVGKKATDLGTAATAAAAALSKTLAGSNKLAQIQKNSPKFPQEGLPVSRVFVTEI